MYPLCLCNSQVSSEIIFSIFKHIIDALNDETRYGQFLMLNPLLVQGSL